MFFDLRFLAIKIKITLQKRPEYKMLEINKCSKWKRALLWKQSKTKYCLKHTYYNRLKKNKLEKLIILIILLDRQMKLKQLEI